MRFFSTTRATSWPRKGKKMAEFVQETRAQLVRWLLHLKREPFNMAFNLLNPVILLIFMGGAFQEIGRAHV